ncbi:MAG TPA: hypothetical protein VFB04_09750 [Terriglobales bacterium]|nr:hypothetical protein [Terriglobales bacterium]
MSQPQVSRAVVRSQPNLKEQSRHNSAGGDGNEQQPASPNGWTTESMLDATCNRLQELLQLLYLLGRDPSVPTEARYHVTVAQSEIALLSRVMQNSAPAHDAASCDPR